MLQSACAPDLRQRLRVVAVRVGEVAIALSASKPLAEHAAAQEAAAAAAALSAVFAAALAAVAVAAGARGAATVQRQDQTYLVVSLAAAAVTIV